VHILTLFRFSTRFFRPRKDASEPVSPAVFAGEQKAAANIAKDMVENGKEYVLDDILKDSYAEIKLRALSVVKAEKTAQAAHDQLANTSIGVTKESIEKARVAVLADGIIRKYIHAYTYMHTHIPS